MDIQGRRALLELTDTKPIHQSTTAGEQAWASNSLGWLGMGKGWLAVFQHCSWQIMMIVRGGDDDDDDVMSYI